MIDLSDVRAAADRIAGHVVRTPTVPSPGLSDFLGVAVTAKLELLQRTGSFKARGVTYKLLSLTDAEREAGVVAVSGGNHAISVAEVSSALGVRATVVMARTAPAQAVERARAAGATVHVAETMVGAFELLGELVEGGLTLVHPFEDPLVVAGQGTVGLELASDAEELTDVVVSVGGGGLISGVAVAVRGMVPGVRVWGVETAGAESMSRALAAGGPVRVDVTSVVSTLGPPSVSQLAYDHVSTLVEEVFVVGDAEAVRGTLDLAAHAKLWGEPAAGCLLPAARKVVERVGDTARIGLVVCGGNASVSDVLSWASRFEVTI